VKAVTTERYPSQIPMDIYKGREIIPIMSVDKMKYGKVKEDEERKKKRDRPTHR
jgi:hypothetical protein